MDRKKDQAKAREEMVLTQLVARGIQSESILSAFRSVPREEFVPLNLKDRAYEDNPLPIGPSQTISQPYIVAYMLEHLDIQPSHKVLEIGTGSGYQTRLLSLLAQEVYSIELSHELTDIAIKRLSGLGAKNIKIKQGDGYLGWREYGPYDRIILSASPPEIPRDLVKQLKIEGKMILPYGTDDQILLLLTKGNDGLESEELGAVKFVPMVPGS